jgi:hypothetical protein
LIDYFFNEVRDCSFSGVSFPIHNDWNNLNRFENLGRNEETEKPFVLRNYWLSPLGGGWWLYVSKRVEESSFPSLG